ncbi:MAG: methyl-accepting chemotaxis protein [Terracidiphilus sp.]|jgi:methyl-accepting chemotaxis protein
MRLTIRRKLFLAFGLAAFMMIGGTGVAYWAQVRAQATRDEIVKTYGILNDLEYLISYVRGVTVVSRAYIISGDETAIAGIPAMRKDADVVAARVQSQIAGDTEQMDHMARYLEAVRQRRVFVNAENKARKEQGFDAAKALFSTGEDDRLLSVMIAEFNEMKVAEKSQLRAEMDKNARLQQLIARTELIGIVLAVVLLSSVTFLVMRSIHKNLQISVEMLGAMAQKDLSGADGRPDSQDELADAIEAINRMKGSMSDALVEVARSSAQVAAAGTEIEATSRQISETAHDEQRNVEFFASSVAQMNATVKDVAGHAERASMAADDAVLTANSGREVVRQSEAAMNRISESVQMASGDIATLGQVTGSIGEVVRIVQDIAEQTNLLALNAAIEAARAGDQGKGFAVVAQEVRVLAERTAKFTKEIAEKIESMQQGTGRAIQSMRQGETVVREGVSQFSQVSTALDAITQRIEAAQQGIAMIATATTQQSAATEGLTESIHSISMEVTKTTNQVDQTALACTELAKLAAVLQNVVNGFQLPAAN